MEDLPESMPIVSIIVAARNAAKTLGRTLDSATSQTYKKKEVIIVDGASTDDTLAIVSRYAADIAVVISEPDNGIADAYNKGINVAKGEWIYFLNADDTFFSGSTLTQIFSSSRYEEYDVIVGKVMADDHRLFSGRYSWRLLMRNYVHHQSIFYRRGLLVNLKYNSAYRRYGHDHEHNLMLWKLRARAFYMPTVIALWNSGGISDSATWADYREEFRVRRNVLGSAAWLWNGFTVARFLIKTSRKALRRAF